MHVKSSASWLITKSRPSPISRLRRCRWSTSSAPLEQQRRFRGVFLGRELVQTTIQFRGDAQIHSHDPWYQISTGGRGPIVGIGADTICCGCRHPPPQPRLRNPRRQHRCPAEHPRVPPGPGPTPTGHRLGHPPHPLRMPIPTGLLRAPRLTARSWPASCRPTAPPGPRHRAWMPRSAAEWPNPMPWTPTGSPFHHGSPLDARGAANELFVLLCSGSCFA